MYDITKKLADIYFNDETKKPSVKNLQYYVGSWEQKIYMMEYKLQEEMLNKLFDKYYALRQNDAFCGYARGRVVAIPYRALLASGSAPPPYSRKSLRCDFP